MKLKILLIGEDSWKVWMNKIIDQYLIYKLDEMMLQNIRVTDSKFISGEVGKGNNTKNEQTEVKFYQFE